MSGDVQHAGTHRPYRPSNGTEGDIFMAAWCERCAMMDHDDPEDTCMIQLRALAHSIDDLEYPAEWQFTNGGTPQCTAFTAEAPAEPRCDKTIDMFAGVEPGQDAGNCATCSRFHSSFVRPICDRADCPIPDDHKGTEQDT